MTVHIVGTGITALTIASRLSFKYPITLFDKARAPGGRLTSRIIDGITLEPGARAFQSTTPEFHQQCEIWQGQGWVREMSRDSLRGVGDERWWEAGQGGWSGSLIKGLVGSIEATWHFNTPYTTSDADIIVYTTPSPQTAALLGTAEIPYRQTLALMYPHAKTSFPAYWRDPPSLSAISTGLDGSGLVLQASPQQLGVDYDRSISSDEAVVDAFKRVCKVELEGEWQLKRWKYAQVLNPPGRRTKLDGRVLIAGDGESEMGGVEGSWHSAQMAVEQILRI